MRVTTELKNLIKRNFDEKKKIVRIEAENAARAEYEALVNEFANSEEFKNYVDAEKAMFAKLDSIKETYGTSTVNERKPWGFYPYRSEQDPKHLIRDEVRNYVYGNSSISNDINRKIDELNLAQESLLIKLTYEKDLDKVKALLAEFDITL